MDVTGNTQLVRGRDEQKFYDELKDAVWVIKIEYQGHFGMATGFCIDSAGLIMTCAHCVPESDPDNSISVARLNDKRYQKAHVLLKIDAWDIAVLCLKKELERKDKASKHYPAVLLAKDGTLSPGQDVYAISHRHCLMYSFCSGKIGYPCQNEVKPFDRLPSRSLGKEPVKNMDVPSITSQYRTHKEISKSRDRNEDLPMVEIRNIDLGPGGSGGPIFLPTREVVAMVQSGNLLSCGAVHVSALQIAFKEAKEIYEIQREKYTATKDGT